jgi:hypothetical protein
LLANIFLHLAFDTWMQHAFPHAPFERYAIFSSYYRTEQQAHALVLPVKDRHLSMQVGGRRQDCLLLHSALYPVFRPLDRALTK